MVRASKPRIGRFPIALFALLMLATSAIACRADQSAAADAEPAASESELGFGGTEPGAEGPTSEGPGDRDQPQSQPVPFIPSGPVGDADAYRDLVDQLADRVPAALRASVPWPDLRQSDPSIVQREIYEYWVWVAENAPDPALADLIAHPDGPARDNPVTLFAELKADGLTERRPAGSYQVLDQTMATFESVDLPLWLARDVPEPAVIIWYTDQSGPVDVVDESGRIVDQGLGTPPRDWLSILVETEVGWLVWVDQLVEPLDTELQRPEFPPTNNDDRGRQGV